MLKNTHPLATAIRVPGLIRGTGTTGAGPVSFARTRDFLLIFTIFR
jgi:hypothetical protein